MSAWLPSPPAIQACAGSTASTARASPPGVDCRAHVAPASVVASTVWAPTAHPARASANEMSESHAELPDPCGVQVIPPSCVRRIVPSAPAAQPFVAMSSTVLRSALVTGGRRRQPAPGRRGGAGDGQQRADGHTRDDEPTPHSRCSSHDPSLSGPALWAGPDRLHHVRPERVGSISRRAREIHGAGGADGAGPPGGDAVDRLEPAAGKHLLRLPGLAAVAGHYAQLVADVARHGPAVERVGEGEPPEVGALVADVQQSARWRRRRSCRAGRRARR